MLSRIETENDFAKALLIEATTHTLIKKTLEHVAKKVIANILKKISSVVLELNNPVFSQYPEKLQIILEYLATKHSFSESQFGALLPEYKSKTDITNSLKNLCKLLQAIEERLATAKDANTLEEMLSVMKCLTDLGWCYTEFLATQNQKYIVIKNMIWPIPEEFDVRIRRDEIDDNQLLSHTFGIAKVIGKDLIPFNFAKGWTAGKSIFFGLSMQKRFEILTQQYDQSAYEYDNLLREQQTHATENVFPEKMKQSSERFNDLRLKMQYYKIPLDKNSRLSISEYAKQYRTSFEKLAHLPCHYGKTPFPMIASVSGSSARTLISLLDTDSFLDTKYQYDLEHIQIIANLIAAYYIHCGHHSFLEVAEVYNRVLDYIAVFDRERLPLSLSQFNQNNNHPYIEQTTMESQLPYFHIGDYHSFLHFSYAKQVLKDRSHNGNTNIPSQ